MSEINKDINVIELLMQIREDVSSIKTDMANIKESQKVEKENTAKEIEEVRRDYKKDIDDLEKRFNNKINSLQSVQNNLVSDVDTLKHADTEKDAKKWRTILTYVGTAVGSMLVVKLPDIIRTLYMIFITK